MERNFCNCVLDPCDYYHNFQVEIRSTDLKVKFNNFLQIYIHIKLSKPQIMVSVELNPQPATKKGNYINEFADLLRVLLKCILKKHHLVLRVPQIV